MLAMLARGCSAPKSLGGSEVMKRPGLWLALFGAGLLAFANLLHWGSEAVIVFIAGGSDDVPDPAFGTFLGAVAVAPLLAGTLAGHVSRASMMTRMAWASLAASMAAFVFSSLTLMLQLSMESIGK